MFVHDSLFDLLRITWWPSAGKTIFLTLRLCYFIHYRVIDICVTFPCLGHDVGIRLYPSVYDHFIYIYFPHLIAYIFPFVLDWTGAVCTKQLKEICQSLDLKLLNALCFNYTSLSLTFVVFVKRLPVHRYNVIFKILSGPLGTSILVLENRIQIPL